MQTIYKNFTFWLYGSKQGLNTETVREGKKEKCSCPFASIDAYKKEKRSCPFASTDAYGHVQPIVLTKTVQGTTIRDCQNKRVAYG